MKVAIVHDWLNQHGGAERVLEEFHEMYPDAPVYTSMYDADRMPAAYRDWDIRTTWMQRLPLVKKKHQPFMPLYPVAFESLDLSGYDLVLSSSSAFCKGVITKPETCHICYCYTPTRFMWNYFDYVNREGLSKSQQRVLAPFLFQLRQWDRVSADRVDYWIGISRLVQQRIAKFYRHKSDLVYPPVNASQFEPSEGHDDYFLVVSRLIPYKRIDLAIAACTQLGLPLKIAGGGRDADKLKKMAGPTVEFLGRVPDDELKTLYSRCRAFLFPGEEDFGITPLEAMASGRPVIAYRGGGALETVVEGMTGAFFDEQTTDSLARVLQSFDESRFDPGAVRSHAETFDSRVFRAQMSAVIERCLADYSENIPTA